jgi:hypothetical protein
MGEFIRRAVVRRTALALLLLVAAVGAATGGDNRAPDLSDYPKLRVGPGHNVAYRAYAEGVQIYRWNGTSWIFQRPEATLYDFGEQAEVVGSHYAGPTWESNSGSYVVGQVLERATPDTNAIPWLKLEATDSDGPGGFDGVTYIQRVNTVGGIAPGYPGGFVGDEARVDYTAEYYFYRAQG